MQGLRQESNVSEKYAATFYNDSMREFDLLSHVYNANAALPAQVTLPPGDDMGAVRLTDPEVLVTVDQLADGVHFDLATTSLARIGRKAVTRNLSDVAAMGAVPSGAVVAACLPADFGSERTLALFDAIRATAALYNCPLFGGDICMWPGKLLLSVTVLATAAPNTRPVLRQGASDGDLICVTGTLGGSMQNVDGRIHHLDFEPRLNVGQKLASDHTIRPSSMLDLSDGLSRDITHLCHAAGLGAQIDQQRLPVSRGAIAASQSDHKPAWLHALADGEDYELCFTISPLRFAAMPKIIHGVPITQVGRMTTRPDIVLVNEQGQQQPLEKLGWEHHSNS